MQVLGAEAEGVAGEEQEHKEHVGLAIIDIN